MNWKIAISTDFGGTWTFVENFSGTHDAGMTRIAVLQGKEPGSYSLEPADAAPAVDAKPAADNASTR